MQIARSRWGGCRRRVKPNLAFLMLRSCCFSRVRWRNPEALVIGPGATLMESCVGQCTSWLVSLAPHCVRNLFQMSAFSSGLVSSNCSPKLLPFTRSCWTHDSRMATKQHSSLQSATGKMQRFSKMSYVASFHNCVLPFYQRAMLMSPHTMSKLGRLACSQAAMAAARASSKASGPATGRLA